MRLLWPILMLLGFVGCAGDGQWIELPAQPAEVPTANIPRSLQQKNWADRGGSGSCVIASSCSAFQWMNRPDLAEQFRRKYAGGQTESSIKAKWRASKIPFVCTETDAEHGDPEILEWATKTRRAAIIWYYPSHCVTFVGFGTWQGRDVAWLLDNNRVGQFIPIEKQTFIRNWRGFGGFAAVPLDQPVPPRPYPGYSRARS